jgi:hypothetical protein
MKTRLGGCGRRRGRRRGRAAPPRAPPPLQQEAATEVQQQLNGFSGSSSSTSSNGACGQALSPFSCGTRSSAAEAAAAEEEGPREGGETYAHVGTTGAASRPPRPLSARARDPRGYLPLLPPLL